MPPWVYRKARQGQSLDLSDLVPLDAETEGIASTRGPPLLGAIEKDSASSASPSPYPVSGVIHESSVESDLSREGKARRIIYAESDIEVDTLREMNRLARITDYVAVKFEDLIKAYESGLVEFIKSLRGNEERRRFALNKVNMCLREHPKGEMESLLE